MHDLHGATFVCSWSGGKDACLAMHRAVTAGGVPRALICLAREDGKTTLTHGIPVCLVQAQADSLGLPLEICPGSWHTYEFVWVQALQRQVAAGVEAAVFGDLFIARHRDWERRVCRNLGLRSLNPLWRGSSRALANELFATHTRAVIACLLAEKLDSSYLGREITPALLNELEAAGVDPFGEHGEYHTLVVDTDLFADPVDARPVGRYLHDGYWYLDFGDGPPVGATMPRPHTGGIQYEPEAEAAKRRKEAPRSEAGRRSMHRPMQGAEQGPCRPVRHSSYGVVGTGQTRPSPGVTGRSWRGT